MWYLRTSVDFADGDFAMVTELNKYLLILSLCKQEVRSNDMRGQTVCFTMRQSNVIRLNAVFQNVLFRSVLNHS